MENTNSAVHVPCQAHYLDEIDSPAANKFIDAHNERTLQALLTPRATQLRDDIKEILDSPDRIVSAVIRGDWAYNFWTDKDHQRGLWRRQPAETYLNATSNSLHEGWEILLDLDALSAAEGKSWVWRGAQGLYPDYQKFLICLSEGGSDSNVYREFAVERKEFVSEEKNGFILTNSKGSASWVDADHLFISRDFGEGTLTDSGYPRQVRYWERGTDPLTAPIIFECSQTEILAAGHRSFQPGFERNLIFHMVDFNNTRIYLAEPPQLAQVNKDEAAQIPQTTEVFQAAKATEISQAANKNWEITLIDCPSSADINLWKNWLLVEPKEPWDYHGQQYPAGSLLVTDLNAYLAGNAEFTTLFTPTDNCALESCTISKDFLVLSLLEDVANKLMIIKAPDPCLTTPAEMHKWEKQELNLENATTNDGQSVPIDRYPSLSLIPLDPYKDNRFWLTISTFLQPTSLGILELAPDSTIKSLQIQQENPRNFPAENFEVLQHFATSADGTQVPYFVIKPRELTEPKPTLLYGYGGFEISLTPAYLGATGKAWLEPGGIYVLANIRGGGEYGPGWHRAALREKRHRAYEDFAAVAKDIVARQYTTHAQLGAMGGSNGGLLMGMMYTKYPDLFGAIVCKVPLLDMRRFHTLLAGASWVAEYGNPEDPADWKFMQTFSPYHLFDPGQNYPPILFTTSTRDDRVHPAHARTMMEKIVAAGKPAFFYENREGGHAGAADNTQAALMNALAWEFLWQTLAP